MKERRTWAIKKISHARKNAYLNELITIADNWMPTVRRMRSSHSWEDVVRVLNSKGQDWTEERLRRVVGRLVSVHMADPALL